MLRRFYAPVSAKSGTTITLDVAETHHLRDVLRLGVNDQVRVFDGEGSEYRCLIRGVDRNSTALEIIEKESRIVESPIDITLCQALVKGEKFDLIVQKATELGVRRIIPVITAHSEIKVNAESANRKLERWQRISMEAVKQSERTRLVEIQVPTTLNVALKTNSDFRYFFAERGESPLKNTRDNASALGQNLTIFIGPEGGWQEEEVSLARDNGCQIVTIGPRILRTETAAITALSLIQYLFGDLAD